MRGLSPKTINAVILTLLYCAKVLVGGLEPETVLPQGGYFTVNFCLLLWGRWIALTQKAQSPQAVVLVIIIEVDRSHVNCFVDNIEITWAILKCGFDLCFRHIISKK